MSRPTLTLKRATVRCTPLYTCVNCGKKREGDTVEIDNIEPDGFGTDDLAALIHVHRISNRHMPVGWAGYGLDRHKCEECQ